LLIYPETKKKILLIYLYIIDYIIGKDNTITALEKTKTTNHPLFEIRKEPVDDEQQNK
jgi:hypothetical protein